MANKKLKQEEPDKNVVKDQKKKLKEAEKIQKKATKKPLTKMDIAKKVIAFCLVFFMLFSTIGTVAYYIAMGALK